MMRSAANLVGCGKFLSDFAGAGTFSTAGLADDERYDFVRGLELLEDGRFQVGEFHGCFVFVSVVGKWHCETSCVNL